MDKDLVFIDSEAELAQHCERLQGSEWLALDTEFERTSTYYPELCLLQLTNSSTVLAVDPLAITDLDPLYHLLYTPSITKVFHAARQDLELFFHLWETLPAPVFDTQIAATLLGYDKEIGYANLVRETLGVELDKTQTRTNWKRRPLTRKQLDYAADDVIYLARLYELFLVKLEAAGQLPELEKSCAALTRPELYQPDPGLMWKKIRAARHFEGKELAVLKQLAAWRELTARTENRPRKWILPDSTLVEMARLLPADRDALAGIEGMDDRKLKKYGAELLDIVNT